MTPNIYEILDEFQQQTTKEDRIKVLQKHKHHHFIQFLKNAFDPNIKYYVNKFPDNYIEPDTVPGIRFAGIESELRRAYLFQIGNPTADSLTPEKRNQLLVQLLESFEPREADFFVRMLSKNLKVPFLTKNIINEAFPNLLWPLKLINLNLIQMNSKSQKNFKIIRMTH